MGKNIFIRKCLVVGIITLLIGVNVSSSIARDADAKTMSPVGFDGNTLYVGGSGPNNYTRIQDAIDDAVDGDTIFVYSRIYFEDLLIIDKSINLIGENANTTIIDGQGSTQGCKLIVLLKDDYIQMKGFTIRDCLNPDWPYSSCAVRIMANYCEFTDNILLEHDDTALEIDGSYHHNMIFNNTISNSEYGIILEYGSRNVLIKGNQISKCYYGIVSNSDRNNISHNNIFGNEMGIYHTNGGYLTIDSNSISKNTMFGIYLDYNEHYDCTHNTVIKNYFNNNLIALISNMPSSSIENNTFILNIFGLRVSANNHIIKCNNFIFNLVNAQFTNCYNNIWESNYWNIPRTKPKPIFGRILWSEPPIVYNKLR